MFIVYFVYLCLRFLAAGLLTNNIFLFIKMNIERNKTETS